MKPTLPGYQIAEFIREGVCGSIWAAEDPVGNPVAVRCFNHLSVNLDLLREVGRRLDGASGEGHGPIPIWLQGLDLSPALEVTPLIADVVDDQLVPRNLQVRLLDYLGTTEAEAVVKCLAKALATLHRHQVVHGNLKPGNVFISEEGRILVADYGLGLMPDIDYLGFTDALLYMAPEQLLDPSGFYREEGYRWDVFAFGVLAYRLLEGHFPRCHENFEDVAPAAGVLEQDGIEVDFEGVAEELMQQEMRPWEGEHDAALKRIVERCLSLDPAERFRDMVELCEVWERETIAARHSAEMEVVARKLRNGRRWRRGLGWSLAGSVAAGMILGTGWFVREHLFGEKIELAKLQRDSAQKREQDALAVRDELFLNDEKIREDLRAARDEIASLSQSRSMLLDWAFAEEGDDLPVLFGRRGRLDLLDKQYQALIDSDQKRDGKWVEQWQTERALLALVRNEPGEARKLIGDEVSRLGGRGLALLLLKESGEKKISRPDLALARNMVKRDSGPQEPWLQSALDLVEVRGMALGNQNERALLLLSEVGARVAKLPAAEPGTVSLWRTRLQREAADVAEGAGRESLAAKFRIEIVAELGNELGAQGLSDNLRQQLQEHYVIAAEGLAEQKYAAGEITEARSLAEKSLALIPNTTKPRVQMALAVHHAVIGGCLRESGKTEQARQELTKGLALLELPLVGVENERWRQYREGMLKWQLSGVMRQAGNRDQELKLGGEALAVMRELLSGGRLRPTDIQLHRVVGYLSGDLAQSYDSQEKREVRNDLLDGAIESWKFLRAANPDESEYVAGLAWCEGLRQE